MRAIAVGLIILLSACGAPKPRTNTTPAVAVTLDTNTQIAQVVTPEQKPAAKALTMADVLAASTAEDWRDIDPANTLVMTLPEGQVVIELADAFSPKHAANLRALVQEKYFDGLAIVRSQDNFVVQWGDPNAENEKLRKPIKQAQKTLKAEFTTAYGLNTPFQKLPDADGYAPEVGFSNGFPVGLDRVTQTIWPAHCYGVVGAGRDTDADSGGGTELYVVTGHAPRQLDRNITVVGRVVAGMEFLSTRLRGPAPMGFYAAAENRTIIRSIELGSNLPLAQRPMLQQLKTHGARFEQLIESRRNRRDDWYKVPAGYIDLCSVPIPVREIKKR